MVLTITATPQRIGVGIGNRTNIVSTADKTAYYVSASGNDSYDGTTPTKAVKTLSKASTLNTSGVRKKVLFKRGDTFVGTLITGYSGASKANPVIYDAYGLGAKPKIYGSLPLSGWTRRSNTNVYVMKANLSDTIKQVFVNGVRQKLARLTNTGYSTISAVTSQTVFTANISTSIDYAGAKVMLRPENYFSEVETVQSSSGATVTLVSAVSEGTIAVNEGAIFMNKLEFLDEAGEFYYNPANDSCYLWAAGNVDPDTFTSVRGSITDNGIYNDGYDYITIQNLEILHQNIAGVNMKGDPAGVNINNCVIDGQEGYGIFSSSGSLMNISNNTINNSNGYGIRVTTTASTIKNNSISNIGIFNKLGLNGTTENNAGSGMLIVGSLSNGNTIEYNTIDSTNYNGIYWAGTSTLAYNYITNTCLSKGDGGAIYSGSATTAGSVIKYNIIDNVVGPMDGYTFTRPYAIGIYLDEGTAGDTVKYNTVINTSDAGIFLHKPSNHTVSYNTIYDTRYGYMNSNTATGTSTVNRNLIITGSATDDYESRQLLTNKATAATINFNYNVYVNGFTSDLLFRGTDGTIRNFTDWKTHVSGDANASYKGTDLNTDETQKVVYNYTTSPKTFYINGATAVTDTSTTVTTSFSVPSFGSKYIRGKSLECVLDYLDVIAPTVTAFTIPSTTSGYVVTISSFTAASDATAYIITESATPPTLTNTGWSSTPQTTFALSTTGVKTLYAYVRDVAGNVSSGTSATTTASFNTSGLTRELMAVYDLEETSGLAQDGSVNTRHASSHDANVTINQSGKPGKSYLFNGSAWNNGRVVINDNNIFTPVDSFSVVVWVKLASTGKAHALVYKGAGSNYEYLTEITSANKANFRIYQNGTTTSMNVLGSTVLQSGVDYFIEFSTTNLLSRSAMKIYVNGVAETTSGTGNSTITNVINGTGNVLIGGESQIGTWLSGNLSQAILYGRTLNSNERAALYQGGFGLNKSSW